jgi:hypothetical protein
MGNGEDDFGAYRHWDEDTYEAAEEAAQAEYDREPEVPDTHFVNLADRLQLSVWETELARPDYYDWFLTKVTT